MKTTVKYFFIGAVLAILFAVISGVDLGMGFLSGFFGLLIFSKFVLGMNFLKRWDEKNTKYILGLPWKITVLYPFWIILLVTLLIPSLKYIPGDPMNNLLCLIFNILFSLILGTIAWFEYIQSKKVIKANEVVM